MSKCEAFEDPNPEDVVVAEFWEITTAIGTTLRRDGSWDLPRITSKATRDSYLSKWLPISTDTNTTTVSEFADTPDMAEKTTQR